MRAKRMMWLAAALVEPVLLYFWHRWLAVARQVPLSWLQASYGLGFALFALLFLGALARWRVTAYPAFWRMATVFAGAVTAALEIGLHGYPRAYFFPLWAGALIGVSAVSLLARHVPQRLRAAWFGKGAEP